MINTEFNTILDLLKAFPDEETCIKHLEELRWGGHVVSPFDPTSKVYTYKGHRYKCKNTDKYFNVKTQTLFDNTKVKLQKWFLAIFLVTGHKKGISSVQLAKDIGVTQKTAWFMLHRIRNCFGMDIDLTGTVEIDETYVGGKDKNRHANKRKHDFGGHEKAPVIGMVERGGNVIAKQVRDTKARTLKPVIGEHVKPGSQVFTDESVAYKPLHRVYDHKFVKHNAGEYVNGAIHTNSIENFWSLLKRGIIGIYHFTSVKHLQNYVDEFAFRYNARDLSQTNRMNLMLSSLEHRLTYKQLINDQG